MPELEHDFLANPLKQISLLLWMCASFLAACSGGAQAGNDPSLPRYAITHANLVPMTAEIILEDQTVLTAGSQITAIGPADEINIPADATLIDGTGYYLMPGLADMHMHTVPAWETDWPVSPFMLFLGNGVTTIRNLDPLADPGNESISPDYALAWRDEILAGNRPGPTMYLTGLTLQGPHDWRPVVSAAGEAQQVVQANVDGGYDFLKIYEFFPSEHYAEAMAVAEEHSMYLTGHIPFEVGLEEAVAGGMDEIAHIIPILYWERAGVYTPGIERTEFLQKWQAKYLAQWEGVDPQTWYAREKETVASIVEILRANEVNVCTTGAGPDITRELITDYQGFMEREDMQYSRRRYLDLISRGEDGGQQAFSQNPGLLDNFIYERDMWLKELNEAGVTLVLGTDAGIGMGLVPGYSVHAELRALIDSGFTPYEALATGTVNASKVVAEMTGRDDFGTLEVGKRADLILVGGNPLADVDNLQEIHGVMAAGRWYPRQALDELLRLDN